MRWGEPVCGSGLVFVHVLVQKTMQGKAWNLILTPHSNIQNSGQWSPSAGTFRIHHTLGCQVVEQATIEKVANCREHELAAKMWCKMKRPSGSCIFTIRIVLSRNCSSSASSLLSSYVEVSRRRKGGSSSLLTIAQPLSIYAGSSEKHTPIHTTTLAADSVIILIYVSHWLSPTVRARVTAGIGCETPVLAPLCECVAITEQISQTQTD